MQTESDLQHVSDDDLVRRLGELVSCSRRVEADLVAHIGEVDARRLYAREASPSMYSYCTKRLHLSEAEAYLRITVARAARRHDVLLEMLRDGRLHLRAIALIAPLLTGENREALLDRATHRSRREVEELVAELRPQPDVRTGVRRLPQRPMPAVGVQPGGLEPAWRDTDSSSRVGPDGGPSDRPRSCSRGEQAQPASGAGADVVEAWPRGESDVPTGVGQDSAGEPPPTGLSELCPGRVPRFDSKHQPAVVPLSPSRYKVVFTASAELHDKLRRLQALMRSEVPDGDLAAIVDKAVSEKLERLEARRLGKTQAPRKTIADTHIAPVSRHVPAAVRRAVVARDGERCHYVDRHGERCPERDRLEFHHRHPFGMGGDHSPDNVSLLCRAHNQLMAEHDYGLPRANRRRPPLMDTAV